MERTVVKKGDDWIELEGTEEFVRAERKNLLPVLGLAPINMPADYGVELVKPPQPPAADIEHDVVAIYDNAGIPSFMHRFRKINSRDIGGPDRTHPAFIIGGQEYDEIYISVYENCNINGKPYSLPYQKPWTNITLPEAEAACFSKGDGWHLMTAAEWGLIAGLSYVNGTLPHGNTSYGKYDRAPEEVGVAASEGGYITLTGSGPATWTHDHTPTGVHDLCGNVWEWVRGLRLKDGIIQVAKDNDAALEIDLTPEGDDWQPMLDAFSEKPIRISAGGKGIRITDKENTEHGWGGCPWDDVKIECFYGQLVELGLRPAEGNAYFYADASDGEYCLICGGAWIHSGNAGVFIANLANGRGNSDVDLGFRSAYFRRRKE